MKIINLKTWERTEFYKCFCKDKNPMYGITTKIDITNVYNFAKKNNLSFYFTFGHLIFKALYKIEEFRIRKIKNKLVVTDDYKIVSFTSLKKDETMFKFIDIEYCDDVFTFCKNAKQEIETQKGLFSVTKKHGYGVFFTCTPWFEFTALSNPKSGDKNDFVPRISWDKIANENNKKFVRLSVEVNHRIIDGLLISKLINNINEEIYKLK